MTINEAFVATRDCLMESTDGMSNDDFLDVLDLVEQEIATHRGSLAQD